MKQRKTIAIIMTVILVLATVLTVFAAFRFEVQFPSKLNTFKYDDASGSFKFDGVDQTFTLGLSDPGSKGEYTAVVQNGTATPLTYAYTISVTMSDGNAADATLLSSIFVYLNGEIMGTLQSLREAGGLLGEDLYVLPNDTENDTLRLELHLASDATPYENASLEVTVNCTATNHNAQKLTFVDTPEKLTQAISEVNRGAADKTIVLYGGLAVPAGLEVTKPCTFDVQENVTFTGPITVNITSEPVDNIPTDIVTVRSTKSKCDPTTDGFTITKGAIDREDSAANITITGIGNATSDSVQYILDGQIDAMLAHGIASGDTIDFATKGIGCYIDSITSSDTTALTTAGKAITGVADLPTSKTVALTVTTTPATPEHTHSVKVIGKGDNAAALFALNGELYYLAQLAQPGVDVSYSIPLPTVLKNKNATIEWHSSDPEKFSNQGVCSPSANGYVTLTAVIRINEQVYTHDVKIHIATLTNEDRLEAMIAAMGNLTLNTIWTGSHQNGKLDQVFMPVTTQQSDGSWQQTYVDSNGVTQELSTFDITNIELTIDEEAYGYIGFQNGTEFVVLDYASFQTMALVNIKATFATGEPKEVSSTICVNIQLGSDTTLGDQVLEYVQSQMNNVNVLQNMLDTRSTDELGDFTLPVEYNGFEIVYTIDGETAASVSDGNFTVYPEHFETSYYSVPVDVKVLIKGATEVTEENTIASRTMYFDVPPVITTDDFGFANVDLFKNVRGQVNSNLPESERWTSGDADNKYILLRDIEKCTSLSIDGTSNGTSSINGLAHFTNLTVFEATNFNSGLATQLARVSATYTNLTELTLSKIGLTDITPLQSLTGLTKLDISGNADLKDITGLVNYDATQLEELNISGTAVNMTHARPMLTDMYYKYEAALQNNGNTPKYYYTHEYTPIADGALLLEPDAISVSGGVATISGTQILISNIELANGQLVALEGGASIQIDGEKAVAVPENTQLSLKKGTWHYSEDTNSAAALEAIISFSLRDELEKSTTAAIVDVLYSGVVTISSKTANEKLTLDGNIITLKSAGELKVNNTWQRDLPAGEIPILCGVISLSADELTVTITPLKGDNGEYSYIGIADEGDNSTITDVTNEAGTVTNELTKIEITGGSIDENIVNIGATGGMIKVTHESGSPFTFAVAANTNITIGKGVRREVSSDGVIVITQIDSSEVFDSIITSVSFTNARIDNLQTRDVNDNTYIVPTVVTQFESMMSIQTKEDLGNGNFKYSEITLTIPAGTNIQLPPNAVGSYDATNNNVTLQTAELASIGNSYVVDKSVGNFTVINATSTGWNDSLTSATITLFRNVNNNPIDATSYVVVNNTWIPITSNFTMSTTIDFWDWIGVIAGSDLVAKSGSITPQGDSIAIVFGSETNNTSSITTASASSFSLDLDSDFSFPTNTTVVHPIEIILPTNSINPTYAGIRTIEEQESAEMSNSSAVYYSESKPIVYGGDWNETTGSVTLNYLWSAIEADGEYITISDTVQGTVVSIVFDDKGTSDTNDDIYVITVSGATSTIGKGALVNTNTTANVTYEAFDPAELKINAIINGVEVSVTANYSTQTIGDKTYTWAKINGMIFEPLVVTSEEKKGLSYLYLLSEVPDVTHYATYQDSENKTGYLHGSFIQLASTIHYGGGGQSVKVAWEIIDDGIEGDGAIIIRHDYFGYARLETVDGAAPGSYEVTIRAQVNVQGLITYRYFTFTVTYFTN